MSEVLAKIKSRGHWMVAIHPERFNPKLVAGIAELEPLARACMVSIHGWSFPHIDPSTIRILADSIESDVDWSTHKEFWRLYQSGQFVFIGALPYEWWDESLFDQPARYWKPGSLLEVQSSLYRVVEIFEFASRLAGSSLAPESVSISIEARGLKERRLWFADPGRAGFSQDRVASLTTFPQKFTIGRERAIADSRRLAFEAARELFSRFGWSPNDAMLDGMLAGLRRAGYSV